MYQLIKHIRIKLQEMLSLVSSHFHDVCYFKDDLTLTFANDHIKCVEYLKSNAFKYIIKHLRTLRKSIKKTVS